MMVRWVRVGYRVRWWWCPPTPQIWIVLYRFYLLKCDFFFFFFYCVESIHHKFEVLLSRTQLSTQARSEIFIFKISLVLEDSIKNFALESLMLYRTIFFQCSVL